MAKQMIKRADGSTSQRGLWDNIRAAAKKNKATGAKPKKPTSAMLKQEKKIKKAQSGVSVSQDKKGNVYYTKKVNTKDGPRYYRGISPDYNMAESEANFKAKRMPQDSTRKATLLPFELKKMDEKKRGGVIKKSKIKRK